MDPGHVTGLDPGLPLGRPWFCVGSQASLPCGRRLASILHVDGSGKAGVDPSPIIHIRQGESVMHLLGIITLDQGMVHRIVSCTHPEGKGDGSQRAPLGHGPILQCFCMSEIPIWHKSLRGPDLGCVWPRQPESQSVARRLRLQWHTYGHSIGCNPM